MENTLATPTISPAAPLDFESNTTLLVVDDEPVNLELVSEFLNGENYSLITAENGLQAWEILQASPEKFDVAIIDRRMPEMNGIELLDRIKADARLKTIPVIIQTADTSSTHILEGLEKGAYYYLTKPYQAALLRSIIRTAVTDRHSYRSLQKEVSERAGALGLMTSGQFEIQTLTEARKLAASLAHACPRPELVVLGLAELFINAVEHGNLGITYDEKTRLNALGTWEQEIEKRLAMPEYAAKRVKVSFAREGSTIQIAIKDDGQGFDWQKYLQINSTRVFDNHGRGIAIASKLSFDKLEYLGNGNTVVATISVSG